MRSYFPKQSKKNTDDNDMSYSPLTGTQTDNNDPFYDAKDKIQEEVRHFTSDFEKWKDALETTNTAKNKNFKDLTENLKLEYRAIKGALQKCQETIQKVENNRVTYPSITQNEIDARNKFVKEMRQVIDDCRNDIQSPKTQDIIKKHQNELKNKNETTTNEESPMQRASRVVNDEFISGQVQVAREEEKVQDEILSDMFSTLKRLGVHGDTINLELEEQNVMLSEVSDEMDTVMGRIKHLTDKLDRLMNFSMGKKMVVIILLLIILVVMIYFMF